MIVQAEHSEGEGSVLFFDFTKMEKPNFGTRIKIRISLLCWIDGDFMPRPAPPGNDEGLASNLKAFIRMTVPAEEDLGFLESEKEIGKIRFRTLAGFDNPAVRKRGLVRTDDNETDFVVPLECFQFLRIPLGLLSNLIFSHFGKIGVHHKNGKVSPDETVPAAMLKMRETAKIMTERFVVIPIKFMISQGRNIRDLLPTKFSVQLVELLPMLF